MPAWHNLVLCISKGLCEAENCASLESISKIACFLRDIPVQIRAPAFFLTFIKAIRFPSSMILFYQNLKQTYRKIEEIFTKYREEHKDKLPSSSPNITPVVVPDNWQYVDGRLSRATLVLGEGYAVKFTPHDVDKESGLGHIVLKMITSSFIERYENHNVYVMRKSGFKSENGLYVPEHVPFGLELGGEKLKVNKMGCGFTLTEDLTEDGQYEVTDITPKHISELDNAQEFAESYFFHMNALLELFQNLEITASIRRHGTPKNPLPLLSRMLLAKIGDNK